MKNKKKRKNVRDLPIRLAKCQVLDSVNSSLILVNSLHNFFTQRQCGGE